ncbi:hypothetical protein EV424DRAFT_1468689 [Suillus variegatus]|nr:hypothetical protein EV424DRAFT_1468689 [Suillus variegatus]
MIKIKHTIATLAVDTNARSMIGMAGSFKTCHPAMVSVTGTSSSPPLSILSAMQLVAKRVFFQDNQVKGCHQFGREDELSKTLDEVNCLYWGGSLVGMAYMFVDEMLKTGKVSQDVVDLIPRLRVVHAALAIPDDPDDSLDAIYLVEEKIHGRFIKYINNNSTVPADSLQGREVVIGLFLCFVQHVQYQLTNSMVYLSDFQGAGDLLTDCQTYTSFSDFANNFGDGNCTTVFDNFKSEHKCNKICCVFGLQAFM